MNNDFEKAKSHLGEVEWRGETEREVRKSALIGGTKKEYV